MSFNTVLASTEEKWNSLVERSASATTYHLWEWGETLSSTYNYRKYYLALMEDSDIIGALPLIHVKSRLFGNRLISLPFCEHGGPLVDPTLDEHEKQNVVKVLLHDVEELVNAAGVEYVEIRNPPLIATENPLFVNCVGFRRYVTFKIDLTKGTEECWRCLNRKTRNAVRKAMKSGIDVKEVKTLQQLKTYYELYLQTQRRHGSPPHSFELFEKLYANFHAKGKMKVLLAEYEEIPIAGIIVFLHNDKMFWWSNVTDRKHRALNPTNMLLWRLIKWGIENECKTLDMGRTRKKTSVHHFKSRWGGQEKPLQDYVLFQNSKRKELPDPEQERYRYLSRLWALLPCMLTKKIGPRIISGIAL